MKRLFILFLSVFILGCSQLPKAENGQVVSKYEVKNEKGEKMYLSPVTSESKHFAITKVGIDFNDGAELTKLLSKDSGVFANNWEWKFAFNVKDYDLKLESVKVELILDGASLLAIYDNKSMYAKPDKYGNSKATLKDGSACRVVQAEFTINKENSFPIVQYKNSNSKADEKYSRMYFWEGTTKNNQNKKSVYIKGSKNLYVYKFTIKPVGLLEEVIYQLSILPFFL